MGYTMAVTEDGRPVVYPVLTAETWLKVVDDYFMLLVAFVDRPDKAFIEQVVSGSRAMLCFMLGARTPEALEAMDAKVHKATEEFLVAANEARETNRENVVYGLANTLGRLALEDG